MSGSRDRAGEASGPAHAAFLRSCEESAVPDEDRATLWELHRSWRRNAVDELERIAQTLADYEQWRLYLRSREGDSEASQKLERRWRGYIRVFLGSASADRVQEVTAVFFERIFRLIGPRFHWRCPFTVYLRSVVINAARDEQRRSEKRRRREVALEEVDAASIELDPLPSPEAALLLEERNRAVRQALLELKPVDRLIVRECLIEGTPGQELAASLGITRNALYQRLYRSRRVLEQVLRQRGLLESGRVASVDKVGRAASQRRSLGEVE